MKKITALLDYKNRFGSKHFDQPYRSGMDKTLLAKHFNALGFDIAFKQFTEVLNDKAGIDTNAFYIYTSSEDENYLYKNFIEDAVLLIETSGGNVIPSYKYLRANNNKVFMELMRNSTRDAGLLSIQSHVFGVKEELLKIKGQLTYPLVVKTAEGASGTGVFKAANEAELLKIVDQVSASKNFIQDAKDHGRALKHKGYIKESRHRKKFIIQNMIEGLKNDWKVYFFFGRVYIFYRPVFKHRDFKASGGGYDNYIYGEEAPKPEGFFNFISRVMSYFDVPQASMDVAFDGQSFHLIEIQFLYFGTAGIPYSKGYYTCEAGHWIFKPGKISIEEVYAASIGGFIESKFLK